MRCEAKFKRDKTWTEQFIWDGFKFEELGGALWIDHEKYMNVIHNNKDKPWLLMMIKSPYSSATENHFQTHEVIMFRIYCAC